MTDFREIYFLLLDSYGKQGWWPLHNSYTGKYELNETEKFEICLGALLTQNTSWINVEKTLDNLRENNTLDINSLRKIDLITLSEFIKSSGYNNQKARKIKKFILFLDSEKEIIREELLGVWGIGEETADSMLLYAYHLPYFVIDTYTKRIFSRLGFFNEPITYQELQNLFYMNLEKDVSLFKEYHALLVEHAKRHCKKKPVCLTCPLKLVCNYYKKEIR